MEKYVTVTVGEIITQIAQKTEIEGYTEGIIEVFLPDAEEWTQKKCNKWIQENNKRMIAICELLNTKNYNP